MRIDTRRLSTMLLACTLVAAASGWAQVSNTLTEQDRIEILALSAAYGPALLGCQPEKYADLFATPGGYFGSGPRGEVRERQALIEMVLSYDRCHEKPASSAEPAAAPGGRGRGPAFPPPVIEWAPEGAKARIINSSGGGYYDEVYVKKRKGWRLKSRNVISAAEVDDNICTENYCALR